MHEITACLNNIEDRNKSKNHVLLAVLHGLGRLQGVNPNENNNNVLYHNIFFALLVKIYQLV